MSIQNGKPVSLIEREIDRKVEAAVAAVIGKGKKPADMGRRDFEAIGAKVYETLSPEAMKKAAREGIEQIAKGIFGEMLAEKLWHSGKGYSVPDPVVIALARKMRFDPPEEAPEWVAIYREDLAECTTSRLEEIYPKSAVRFLPLFTDEPLDALLGEVAVRKAAKGDPLALAFLSGREGSRL